MERPLDAGKYLHAVLSPVCPRCYPVVAEMTTVFPFMVYRRVRLGRSLTKDGMVDAVYRLDIAASTYSGGVALATGVLAALEAAEPSGLVWSIDAEFGPEDWRNDAYTQEMTITLHMR